MNNEIEFNDIGILSQLDYKRIKKLLTFGIIGAILNIIGDMLLGYGIEDTSINGIERLFSKYASISDIRMFFSSFIGMIGIVLGGLSLFSIYRIIAGHSSNLAHHFRTGIFGYLIFGPMYHVLFLVICYLYKHQYEVCPDTAFSISFKALLYFVLPTLILFMLFFIYLIITMIIAFSKKKTDFPKWCAIFNPFTIMILCIPLYFINNPVISAIASAWISLGFLFMYAGLLTFTLKLKL